MIFRYMTPKERHWTGLKLGEFVSNLVRRTTVEELNKLDRYELASRIWWRSLSEWEIDKIRKNLHGEPIDIFFEEAAIWIDERIPKAYKKWVEHRHDTGPAGISVDCDENGNVEYGFIYRYEINSIRVKNRSDAFPKEKIFATYKQLSYLDFLASKHGYNRSDSQMTVKEASAFIDYFKNSLAGEKPPKFEECFEFGN